MNTNTLYKMQNMRLYGMFHAFKNSLETKQGSDYTADELLAQLIDAEWDDRQNRRIERQILYARFRYKASIENIHYHDERNIDRNHVLFPKIGPIKSRKNTFNLGAMKQIRFTESQIVKALKEYNSGRLVPDICRELSIHHSTFYKWKQRYGGLEVSDLIRLKHIEEENSRLKKMYANLSLCHEALKDVLAKKF